MPSSAKALRGSLGARVSKIVGTPAAHSSSSGRAASSSSVTSMSSPVQPRLSIAGAPGLSIKVTLVPVSS